MNRKYINLVIVLIGIIFFSCEEDYLDRPPKDRLDAETFFTTAKDLEVYINGFYDNMFPAPHSYESLDDADDNIVPLIIRDRVKGTRIAPVPRGSEGWSWSELRSINFFLQNYHRCEDVQAKLKYGGIARFHRAFFYYKKVKTFGDVPWYGKVLEAGDEDLYKARDPRKMVMDSVLADINYAVENIPAEVKLNTITKYTALALKARICLFEGTFRKYHNLGDHQKFLNEAVSAAEQLINSNAYKLFTTGGANVAYRELFARNSQTTTETILARDYDNEFIRHSLGYMMTAPTAGAWGLPKDLINSYLMKDGSRFTDIPGYDKMGFYDEMQNRDPRLTQTTAGPDFAAYGEATREPVNLSGTTTGYRVIKALPERKQWASLSSYNDIIYFRYAETLLIYAEAKAELGTLTQADLDKSINKLRDRVAMPHLKLTEANASPDPYQEAMYPNVDKGANKGVILEIRRERRIELFNEGLRWDDLMRWKEGKKLEKPMVGIYFSGLGSFDFNNDGKTDVFLHNKSASGAPAGTSTIIDIRQRPLTDGLSGNLNPFREKVTFDESKDYYYPIPIEDINLNGNLVQNPGWN
ncbi:MAG: RagB/SusD family nutrient uptake outer membrane protein [Prolixibacteraceae bacterium]|jgi:hypothetical protein|nr:RagB/SusD family nutrient uptake outer membrane protein [Prolixibacteraceae bacterium]